MKDEALNIYFRWYSSKLNTTDPVVSANKDIVATVEIMDTYETHPKIPMTRMVKKIAKITNPALFVVPGFDCVEYTPGFGCVG